MANDRSRLFEQVALALAGGNQVLLQAGGGLDRLATLIKPWVQLSASLAQAPGLAAVLYSGSSADRDALGRALAQRSGMIVQLVEYQGRGDEIYRMLVERSTSVNTTAAGGNASLMSMSE